MPDRKSFQSGPEILRKLMRLPSSDRSGSVAIENSEAGESDIDVGLGRIPTPRSDVDSLGDRDSEEDWGEVNPLRRRSRSRESVDSVPAEVAAPFRRRRRIVSASSEDEQ